MVIWIVFIAVIIVFLAIDLGVFNKDAHVIGNKEALTWTSIWVTLALSFSGVVYWIYSNDMMPNADGLTASEATLKYVTGYLIELSLSVDNIFVIALIFTAFKIPLKFQHRVLFWGILGAIVFRVLMILFGVLLIEKFAWTTYVFGAFLLFTAVKMILPEKEENDPRKSLIFKTVKRFIPVTKELDSGQFLVKKRHLTAATPLFLALVIIEFTDILFALDSIPAILAITTDPFLVFSSNILAIMGLRSMFFLLSNMMEKFDYLNYSLAVILSFVGIKLILAHHYTFPEWMSLGLIAVALAAGVGFSMLKNKREEVEKS